MTAIPVHRFLHNPTSRGDFPRNRAEKSLRNFGESWSRWLASEFATGAQVAAAFGVTERTGRGWLDGSSEPRGRHVARALVRYPSARRHILGDAR